MKLNLSRDLLTPTCTHGKLYVDGVFFCYTMEDTDRHLEAGGVKIAKQTAIPRGKYNVVIDMSNRFKKLMPHVLDVPGFAGIRIHSGNTAEDTEGCILLGNLRAPSAVLESRAAFQRFFPLLGKALARGEAVTLEVQ